MSGQRSKPAPDSGHEGGSVSRHFECRDEAQGLLRLSRTAESGSRAMVTVGAISCRLPADHLGLKPPLITRVLGGHCTRLESVATADVVFQGIAGAGIKAPGRVKPGRLPTDRTLPCRTT